MGYSQDRARDTAADSRSTLRTQRAASRSDLFPRLVTMQKAINARHFGVLRVSGSGLPSKRKLQCELENFGTGNGEAALSIIDAYGEAMIEHIEKSMLPLMWNGREEGHLAEAPDFSLFTVRLKGRVLPFSGVAFPVRLGAIGNGFILFTSNYIDLSSDVIVDLHGKSCAVMMDLLALDERRSGPAETLSEREIACLQLAGDGRISEEIADKLGLSVHTVNAYLGSATIKLDSVNRIQAIAKAIRLGYIS